MKVALSDKYLRPLKQYGQRAMNISDELPERIIGCRYYPKYCGISLKNTKGGSTIHLSLRK